MENKRLSMDELSQKLVSSRKIMKKVDDGNFEKGAISENMIESPPENELLAAPPAGHQPQQPVNTSLHKAPAPITEDRVNQSKLPDNIKKAMLENPIPQIGLDSTLDMDFVEKTRRLMEEDGSAVPKRPVSKTQPIQETTQAAQPQAKKTTISSGELERRLTPIIENVIRKTLDEIVDRKLTQILSASQSQTINENLAIKVGETIFTGKLTKAKSTK